MKKLALCLLAGVLLSLAASQATAIDYANANAARFAQTMTWHGDYYYTQWGVPVSLVVPPTAHMHREMGWGVSQSSMYPIWHQFKRGYNGQYEAGSGKQFLPTPLWPSHTEQFGVYYIRGPW